MKYLPIDVLDLAICREYDRIGSPGLFFIQIGAHDGSSVDPIYRYIENDLWDGVFVEPQPKIFERLKTAYCQKPHFKPAFENVAIGPEDGNARLYAFKEGQDLPYHATMLASFSRMSLERNTHGYRGEIEELIVPSMCVETLLAKHRPCKQVDLLQIDTEGCDLPIIEAFVDANCLPTIIHFEDTIGLTEANPLVKRLNDLGYGLSHFYPDTIAYRQNAGDDFRRRVMATQDELEQLT